MITPKQFCNHYGLDLDCRGVVSGNREYWSFSLDEDRPYNLIFFQDVFRLCRMSDRIEIEVVIPPDFSYCMSMNNSGCVMPTNFICIEGL